MLCAAVPLPQHHFASTLFFVYTFQFTSFQQWDRGWRGLHLLVYPLLYCGSQTVQPIPFTRTLTSSPWYECASWHQHVGSKTLFKNHPLVNWQCQLTQVVLYNCCKMIAVVVPTMIQDFDYRNTKYILITLKQPFNGLFSRTTWVSRYQKGKTNLDFTGARDSELQWHQLGHMQACTSPQTDNHASTPPLCFFTGRMPFLPPNQQRQSTEGTAYVWIGINNVTTDSQR